jgi:hypothetical protein
VEGHLVYWGQLPPQASVGYGMICDCKGYRFRGTCRHAKQAETMRCGWHAFVHGDEPSGAGHGVYAPDRSEALVAYAQLSSGMSLLPPVLRVPGLTPDQRYRIEEISLGGGRRPLEPLQMTGRQLAAHGLQLPPLAPESGILLYVY